MSKFCVISVATCLILLNACTSIRYGQTAIGQAIDSPVSLQYEWGEVYCGRGAVCAETEVLTVNFEDRDGGRIEVTLHNRTGSSVAVQIGLEILNQNGVRLDSTQFQNVALPPRQEIVWEMPGVYKKGTKIRVILRQRTT